jgi:magnesium transporter
MKNPLLVPELREMLASRNIDEIREFCISTPAPVAAEFLGALTPQEQWDILGDLTPDLRGLIFSYFDDDVKLPLLELTTEDELIELIMCIAEEERLNFFKVVSRDRLRDFRALLLRQPAAEVTAIIDELDSLLTAEAPEEEVLSAEEIASEISQEIEVYKVIDKRLERVNRIEKGCWINIVNPPKETLPLLAQHFSVPIDFITSSLDMDEIARVEVEENATLIIVKVPYYDETSVDIMYFTVPIGIILVNGNIITVCAKENSILNDFIANKVRHVSSTKEHKFILQIILRATILYLQYLKQLNNAANIIQKKLEQESKNKQLIKLLNIEKSLVYFTTSLKTNGLMLERLQRLHILVMDEENENIFEDIVTESKQAIEMANIYSDILSGMMDAFASVISNNLNIVMKILTSITIIITIPVLVTSFYGMNIRLPFQEHPAAVLIVIGTSVILSLLAILFFIKKKWLEP